MAMVIPIHSEIQKIPPEIRDIIWGLLFAVVCWLILRPRGLKSPIFQAILTKTKKGREFLSLLCSILILEIGTVISLYTLGDNSMTDSTIQWLIHIIWATIGIATGMFIILLYQAARFYWKYRVDNKPDRFLAKIYNKQYKELGKERGHRMAKQCPFCGTIKYLVRKGTVFRRKFICENEGCTKYHQQVIPVETRSKKWR